MGILTELSDRVGLRTNTEKTKVMTCVNEKVHVRRSEEVYRNTMAGFHTEKDWRNRRVTCDHCGLEMSAKSLPGHLESQHGSRMARVNRPRRVRRDSEETDRRCLHCEPADFRSMCGREEAAKRPRGSSYHLFWWEQPVDLNLARGGEQSSPGVAADDFSRGRRSGRRRVPVTLPELYAYAAPVGKTLGCPEAKLPSIHPIPIGSGETPLTHVATSTTTEYAATEVGSPTVDSEKCGWMAGALGKIRDQQQMG
ncbi:hypothetical protein THAOC_18121 [Thalassiosira oceanica]|uniref:Uncharacterized protein n=1 Tax=Thalassiosira oceanica TaxID=159749 RepID=K0SSY8_THAOC|nr:hypothetical protein THAOC_18121 [Thalassiosira oceanica]|eukprot:EJK61402.1 hypothetical protein THAOC_18121 [Thalassiosira oceanica]